MLIRKGNHKLDVSPDAFKSMYKRLGYEEIKKSKQLVNVEVKENKATEEKSVENKATEEKSTENKPVENKPVENKKDNK